MKRPTIIALASLHAVALAISTYIAATHIESILVTGWVCSATGVLLAIVSIDANKPWLLLVGLLTPILALTLIVLEGVYLHLGPRRAAMPFCIVFIVHHVIATLTILIQIRLFDRRIGEHAASQVTLESLMLSTFIFAVFFAVTKYLLLRQHDWLMAIALGMMGLTFVGLTMSIYSVATAPNLPAKSPEPKPKEPEIFL